MPDTLVTTDPADARALLAEHRRVIYKSTSGVRSIASLLGPDHNNRLSNVSTCPTQFQQYVAGTDHRVHVVGEEVFACRIDSEAVDYRYAAWSGHHSSNRPVVLDDDVVKRCRALTEALGLDLAGIDVRQDTDGVWWCFEVNTSPGFVWFEHQTGQPVAEAVASLLAGLAGGNNLTPTRTGARRQSSWAVSGPLRVR